MERQEIARDRNMMMKRKCWFIGLGWFHYGYLETEWEGSKREEPNDAKRVDKRNEIIKKDRKEMKLINH